MATVFDFETDPHAYSDEQLTFYGIPNNPDDVYIASAEPVYRAVQLGTSFETQLRFEPYDSPKLFTETQQKIKNQRYEIVIDKPVPSVPIVLLPTHFRTNKSVSEIISQLRQHFDEKLREVDYIILEDSCSVSQFLKQLYHYSW